MIGWTVLGIRKTVSRSEVMPLNLAANAVAAQITRWLGERREERKQVTIEADAFKAIECQTMEGGAKKRVEAGRTYNMPQ